MGKESIVASLIENIPDLKKFEFRPLSINEMYNKTSKLRLILNTAKEATELEQFLSKMNITFDDDKSSNLIVATEKNFEFRKVFISNLPKSTTLDDLINLEIDAPKSQNLNFSEKFEFSGDELVSSENENVKKIKPFEKAVDIRIVKRENNSWGFVYFENEKNVEDLGKMEINLENVNLQINITTKRKHIAGSFRSDVASFRNAVTKGNETVNSDKLKIVIHNLPEDISDADIKNLEGINVARSSVLNNRMCFLNFDSLKDSQNAYKIIKEKILSKELHIDLKQVEYQPFKIVIKNFSKDLTEDNVTDYNGINPSHSNIWTSPTGYRLCYLHFTNEDDANKARDILSQSITINNVKIDSKDVAFD